MNDKSILNLAKSMSGKQKLVAIGIISLLTIGAFGAMNEYSGNKQIGVFSGLAETLGLKKKEVNTAENLPLPTGTPQISKEYVYAGSRMLATEDYGLAPANPTPTP